MGPICVAAHLAPFLPSNPLVKTGGEHAITSSSSAPYGSASILPISYAYISMMGGDGLTRATQIAILNANYIKERLSGNYPLLYTGSKGRAAHEMIVDCRSFKEAGVEVEDIAKRLGSHGENALTDVSRKTLRMRIAKLLFRLRKLVLGGCLPPLQLSYEITTDQKTRARRSIAFPRLGF